MTRHPTCKILFLLGVCVCCLVGRASASILTLVTDAPPGNSLEAAPGIESAPITVSVLNDATPDDPKDFLTGWQISLEIIPEAGAVGLVTFASPAGPGAAEPANYVLGTNGFVISVTNTGNGLDAFDFNFPYTGGVEVPTDPGAALLQFTLLSSSDAAGDFGIYAVAGLGGSEWTDASPGIQVSHSFANVTPTTVSTRIGVVNVRGVPEPGVLTLWGVGLVLAISRGRMRARR
jgi:hypothetical protein